jgi:hypothetical protein
MASLQLDDKQQADFREDSARQVGITVTPRKEWCINCETMRTQTTGQLTAAGFVCHGCSNPGANPEMKNPAVSGPGRPGGVL